MPEAAVSVEREEIEASIHTALSAGDPDRAVTALLQGYGPEVLRFLAARHRDEDEAAEVFSKFAEAVWTAAGSARMTSHAW